MVARVNTVAFRGIDVVDVGAQVQMAAGRPAFTIADPPVLRICRPLFRSGFDCAQPLSAPHKKGGFSTTHLLTSGYIVPTFSRELGKGERLCEPSKCPMRCGKL